MQYDYQYFLWSGQTETNTVLHRGVLNKIFKITVNTVQVQARMCFLLSHLETYNFSGNDIYSKRNVLTLCETCGPVFFYISSYNPRSASLDLYFHLLKNKGKGQGIVFEASWDVKRAIRILGMALYGVILRGSLKGSSCLWPSFFPSKYSCFKLCWNTCSRLSNPASR